MKIDDNSLFFTCSLLELIGRTTRQKRSAVTELLGKKVIAHIYANADVLHCEPIAKTADYYIDFCHIPAGDFDNVADCKYAVPSYWDIGKVYARLIEDVAVSDAVDTLFMVYHSVVSDMISNYNSDFFYQSREYIKEYFISNGDSFKIKQRKPAIRFSGFTDAWEQRKLASETTEIIAGGDVEKTILKEKGNFPVIANALTNDGVVGYYEYSFRVKAPAVTVTGRGDVGHAKARVVDFTPVVRLLSLKSRHDVFFMENAINNMRIVIESTGVPQLTVPQLSQYEIFYPQTILEEKKIGQFFRALDQLITLHQRELEKLKKIKQSCLEKMFV